ncbi:hypothetical protein CAL22_01760 [Bordetella genomosp. 12]|uniref:L-aspartate dehydrogenase n=2 Tax=Bordetella genomosp. 12 TaxID=463035 RepID=A0A261VV50_9BORD|nr:hypothetical protein CAL22_01760 [Bordetella genomosp. 12]
MHGARSTPPAPLRVGMIGYGAIGQSLARSLLAHPGQVQLTGVLTQSLEQGKAACTGELAAVAARLMSDRAEMLAQRPDLVIECAGHAAVDAHAAVVLQAGCDLMVVSIGALADERRRHALQEAASRHGRQILLVAGAIGGIDWLAAAREAGLHQVIYRGRKPPGAWKGSAAEHALDLDGLTEPTLFFEGDAAQAARDYPRNANVAATVALATLGMSQTRVQLWADPTLTENLHEVEATGRAGRLRVQLENHPEADNPRTSMITAYSILRAVLNRRAAIVL